MYFNIWINRKYAIGFENDFENENNNIRKFILLRMVKLVFLEYFNSQYMLYLVSFLWIRFSEKTKTLIEIV